MPENRLNWWPGYCSVQFAHLARTKLNRTKEDSMRRFILLIILSLSVFP